jgi:hypothetical protein
VLFDTLRLSNASSSFPSYLKPNFMFVRSFIEQQVFASFYSGIPSYLEHNFLDHGRIKVTLEKHMSMDWI